MKKKMEIRKRMEMKTSKLIVLLLSVFLLVSSITLIIYSYKFQRLDVRTIPVDVYVDHQIGINVDTDSFHFGKVPPGGNSKKEFEIRNQKNFRKA